MFTSLNDVFIIFIMILAFIMLYKYYELIKTYCTKISGGGNRENEYDTIFKNLNNYIYNDDKIKYPYMDWYKHSKYYRYKNDLIYDDNISNLNNYSDRNVPSENNITKSEFFVNLKKLETDIILISQHFVNKDESNLDLIIYQYNILILKLIKNTIGTDSILYLLYNTDIITLLNETAKIISSENIIRQNINIPKNKIKYYIFNTNIFDVLYIYISNICIKLIDIGKKVLCILVRHSRDIAYFKKFNNIEEIYNSQYRISIILNKDELLSEYVPIIGTPLTTFNTKIIQYIKNNIDVYMTQFHGRELPNKDHVTLRDNEYVVYNCNPGLISFHDFSIISINYLYHITSKTLINMKKTTFNTIDDILKPFEIITRHIIGIRNQLSNMQSNYISEDFVNFITKIEDMLIEIFESDIFFKRAKTEIFINTCLKYLKIRSKLLLNDIFKNSDHTEFCVYNKEKPVPNVFLSGGTNRKYGSNRPWNRYGLYSFPMEYTFNEQEKKKFVTQMNKQYEAENKKKNKINLTRHIYNIERFKQTENTKMLNDILTKSYNPDMEIKAINDEIENYNKSIDPSEKLQTYKTIKKKITNTAHIISDLVKRRYDFNIIEIENRIIEYGKYDPFNSKHTTLKDIIIKLRELSPNGFILYCDACRNL